MGIFDKIFGKKGKTNSSNANRKKCPSCGREVNATAFNCGFCGHRFSNQSIPKTSTNNSKTQSFKRVNKPAVNNYAAMFRSQMEISGGNPSENDSLYSLVKEWEKNFPDDKNLFFAKAILDSGNLFVSKDKILDLISDGEYAPTMYDSSNYIWFYDTAMEYYRRR